MAYQPIENYGIIGNMHTVAMVGMNGSIDWFCFPHFDSPSVFGAILDDKKAGRFQISPIESVNTKQLYWPGTNVLITRFLSPHGVGEVIDYMPADSGQSHDVYHQIIRRVRVVRGSLKFRVVCQPAFNYARTAHTTEVTERGACFGTPELRLGLATGIPLAQDGSGVACEFTRSEGQTAVFVLRQIPDGTSCGPVLTVGEEEELFRSTVNYWRQWLSQCNYRGRWREMVERSALALKLLTFKPTGAIVAAPTCSLPEDIGGERNWDYRYTWIRDAAFTLYGLMRIGFTEEPADSWSGSVRASGKQIRMGPSRSCMESMGGMNSPRRA